MNRALIVDTSTGEILIPDASEINEAHRLARDSAETSVQYAIRCGELLTAKKATLRHGEWKAWVEANCEFSYRSARVYMSAARQNGRPLPFSSLAQALGYGTADTLALKHTGDEESYTPVEYLESARAVAARQKCNALHFSTLREALGYDKAQPEPPALPAPFDLSDPAIVYTRAVGTKALLVQASAEHAGFAHILQIDSDQGGGAIADYTRRAVRSDYVLQFADRMQPKGAGTAWEALNEGPNHVFDLIAPWIAEDRAVDLAPAP